MLRITPKFNNGPLQKIEGVHPLNGLEALMSIRSLHPRLTNPTMNTTVSAGKMTATHQNNETPPTP